MSSQTLQIMIQDSRATINNVDRLNLTIFDWSNADFTGINNYLCGIDWNCVFGYNFDADSIWNAFKCTIWPIIEIFVPTKTVHHYHEYRPRQYPKHIRKLLIKKSAIWHRLKNNKSPDLLSNYRSISDLCKLEIFKFDSEREEKLLKANNLGAFYKFVNQKLSSRSGVAPLKSPNNNLLTNDMDKANLLNSYFQSVFISDDGKLPPFPNRLNSATTNISDINISPTVIQNVLKKLKKNSAAGPDNIPSTFYHHTASTISYPLDILYRTLIESHTLPSKWRLSIITPKFKKGSPSDPTNYRPIALTCSCCKILESIIASNILAFLLEHNLITHDQHGFLKKHSTCTNLLESINDWTLTISKHNSVTIAYLDFKSAFFFNTNFVSSHMYPENPEGTQVIVGSMNMGYISDTARSRTHNLIRHKREPIPLGHSDGHLIAYLTPS